MLFEEVADGYGGGVSSRGMGKRKWQSPNLFGVVDFAVRPLVGADAEIIRLVFFFFAFAVAVGQGRGFVGGGC